jgi:hypothetical protein
MGGIYKQKVQDLHDIQEVVMEEQFYVQVNTRISYE